MLIPAVVLLFVFHYLPLFGVLVAFEDYTPKLGIWNSKWIGTENFAAFLSSDHFPTLLRNVLTISSYALLVGFPAPILLALLINELQHVRYKKVVQCISFMPYFISTLVICGMLRNFLAGDGPLNALRRLVGQEPIYYLSEARYFPSIIVWLGVWQSVGWNAIIYTAALNAIDVRLYEAARIDGCNRFQLAWHITLPGLMPTIVVLLLLNLGSLFSVASENILLLYTPLTYETGDVFATFVYRYGIRNGNYGYSTAVGLVESVLNFTMLVVFNKISKRVNGKGLW